MMEQDPDKINDPNRNGDADRQIEARLYEQAQNYAVTRTESKKLNEKRATSRKKIEEMGFRKDAYQTAIRVVKDLSPREREDFMRDLNLIISVLGKRQADLFPEEVLKIAKREDIRKAENKPKTAAEADKKSDANPRSDPASGGAGGKPSEEDLTAAAAAAAEQQEGGEALGAALPETKTAQSKKAAAKLAAAGLN